MTVYTAEPESTEIEEKWVLPEKVEAPTTDDWLDFGKKAGAIVGIRAAGWATLGSGVVALIIGAIARWQELRLLGIFALLLLAVALLFTIGHPSYQVQLAVESQRVTVGEEARGQLRVGNIASRRAMPARLDLPIGPEIASFAIPSLAAGGYCDDQFFIPTERRAILTVGPAKTVQGDPFSLAGRETRWTDSVEIFVHPVTVPLMGRQTGFIHDLEGQSTTRPSASDMSFQSLREYVPGDDRRQIHWKSTAHLGKLLVRQYEETLQSRVAVGLDVGASSYLGEDDFELAVSAVGSVCLQSIREENPLRMFAGERALPAVSGPKILDGLSGVERVGKSGLGALCETIRSRADKASVVFIITGATTTLDQMRLAAMNFSLDARVIMVKCDPTARNRVRNIANVAYTQVTDLQDLPSVMRRAMS